MNLKKELKNLTERDWHRLKRKFEIIFHKQIRKYYIFFIQDSVINSSRTTSPTSSIDVLNN